MPGQGQADLAAGYQKIGSRAPFTKSDVQKAYEPYGLKLDSGRKKATDKQLHTTAAKAVVDWFKKSKVAKAAAQKPSPTQAPPNRAPSGSSAPASTGTSAPRAAAPSSSTRNFYNDDYVARAMRTIGLAGVAPSSIPEEFRRSYASLVTYLNKVKAQRALAQPRTIGPKTTSRSGGGLKLYR